MALVHAVCRHCCVQVCSVDASVAGDRVEAGRTNSTESPLPNLSDQSQSTE